MGLGMITETMGQTINTEKSVVEFKIRNMGVRTVTGTFKGMEGNVNFSANNPSASEFEVCIKTATINTENKKRDEHLKGADYFDAEKYPTICFKSSQVSRTSDGYLVKGKLMLHGITKYVEFPFKYTQNVFSGSLKLNRLDYKIGGDGTFMVGSNVELTITCRTD